MHPVETETAGTYSICCWATLHRTIGYHGPYYCHLCDTAHCGCAAPDQARYTDAGVVHVGRITRRWFCAHCNLPIGTQGAVR